MEDKSFKSRIETRIRTLVTAFFKSNNPGDVAKEGVITNFSRSGFFIETTIVFPINSYILIDVFLPEEKTPLHLAGEVRNIVKDENVNSGMGVKIHQDSITEEDKDRLKEFFDLNHIYGWFC